MSTYSTSSGSTPERSSAARIAIEPSCVACCPARPPPSLPNGVRTAETITERVMQAAYPDPTRPLAVPVAMLTPTPMTIQTDLVTPLGAYLRLRRGARASFLLESVERGRLGRYSFVGAGSRLVALDQAEALGGPVVGYVGYDWAAVLEPTVPLPADGTAFPGSRFVVADTLVRFDHVSGVAEVLAGDAGRGRCGARGAAGRGRAWRRRRGAAAPLPRASRLRGERPARAGAHPKRATPSRSSSRSGPSARRARRRSRSTAPSAA